MHMRAILRLLGALMLMFSPALLPALLLALWFDDGMTAAFSTTIAVGCSGGLLWLLLFKDSQELNRRDGFLAVVLCWSVLGLLGALPFYLNPALPLSPIDAIFESLSGLTTTGATIITQLDKLPPSLLFYRQQLQWFGGMGIILLAIAILPMLGIGGMQLHQAEITGPLRNQKLTPRIAETAKALWYIYLLLTVACAISYRLAGMSTFDAISHSFSTVSIGGFSTHDSSMLYFDSWAVEAVAIVFMVLSGINFALHFHALRWFRSRHQNSRRWQSHKLYHHDPEFLTYISLLTISGLVIALLLWSSGLFSQPSQALRHGLFQAVSIGTTSGFTTANYFDWPPLFGISLIFLSFVGGCAGSVSGGLKVMRVLLMCKQGLRELRRLIHPQAEFVIKISSRPLPEKVVEAIWGFFSAYVFLFVILMLLLLASGLDQVSAFSAVAATMNNLGPGLGSVGPHYADINDFAKALLCLSMLFGRLEIFTLLVLLIPDYWKP